MKQNTSRVFGILLLFMNRVQAYRFKKLAVSIFRGLFLFGICFIIIYPHIMKLAISLRSVDDIYDSSIIYIPKHFSLQSFQTVLEYLDINEVLFNSLFVCIVASLLHCISCTITAYSLAKFNSPIRKIVYAAVLLAFFVPPSLLSLPMYRTFMNFDIFGIFGLLGLPEINMIDNPVSLFLLYATATALKSGLYIYLLIQFFRGMPKELDEAAFVDGAGLFRTFISVNLPSARTMILTVFLFSFIWQWTDLQYTGMFFKNFQTFSAKMAVLGGTLVQAQNDIGNFSPVMLSQLTNAAVILFILPLVILYIFTNKFFVQGIERSGIVG